MSEFSFKVRRIIEYPLEMLCFQPNQASSDISWRALNAGRGPEERNKWRRLRPVLRGPY